MILSTAEPCGTAIPGLSRHQASTADYHLQVPLAPFTRLEFSNSSPTLFGSHNDLMTQSLKNPKENRARS